jgi:hypothetical protein
MSNQQPTRVSHSRNDSDIYMMRIAVDDASGRKIATQFPCEV